jgi:hypothetical protein
MKTPSFSLRSWWQVHRKEVFALLLVFVIWRATLFLIGSLADTFLPYAPQFPYAENLLPSYHLPRWIYSWANFDGVHYLTIAEKGYIGTGLIQAFFPLFPYVMLHTFFQVTQHHINTLALGLFLGNFFALLMLGSWYFFMADAYDKKTAIISTAALLLFPAAFFWGALYTESLFFILVIWTFWFAHHKKWRWVTLSILLASATRIVGIFLLPAVWIEIFLNYTSFSMHTPLKKVPTLLNNFFRDHGPKLLLTSLGSIGLLSYMFFLQGEFHDPLYFAHVQSSFGAGRESHVMLYPQVVWRSVRILLTARPINWRYFTYIQEFIAGFIGAIVLFLSVKQVKRSYWFFALSAFVLPTVTGTFSSMPRYILVCFPIYILLAKLAQKYKALGWLLLLISVVTLVINTVLFIQGYWVG